MIPELNNNWIGVDFMYFDLFATSYKIEKHSYDSYCLIEHVNVDNIFAWLRQQKIA